jgi:hypothetical protein
MKLLLPILPILLIAALPVCAEPRPGDIYREFHYTNRFGEIHPGATREGVDHMKAVAMAPRNLEVPSLGGVVRAEVSAEYWGGHIGTSDQKFRITGNAWHMIPQPLTPEQPSQCYYRTMLGSATTDIPLAELKAGINEFRFTAGPQLCNCFNWGFYWVYSFTLRLYYKDTVQHPTGEVVLPASGAVLGERPTLTATATPADATIAAVDYIGNYRDFNWEGDGQFRRWHYITEQGAMRRHIGGSTHAPYAVQWDTTWIPDQDEPVEIAARITDSAGRMYLTPAVKAVFRRSGRSVRMYTSPDVPKGFGVRVGRRKECTFLVDADLSKIRAARLTLSTWSAAHDGEMGLNNSKLVDRLGFIHNYSFDSIVVPPRLVKAGENQFYVFSTTEEHAPEINWPGPVLLVEYSAPETAASAAGTVAVEEVADFEGQAAIRVRTPAATYVYHKDGGAFASIQDAAGVEWIGYKPGGRASGEFRGIPNLGDDFGHPGAHGAVTRIASQSQARVEIVSESKDGAASLRWEITPSRATMTLEKSAKPYWFLYEGTPAGRLDTAHAYFVTSNGARRPLGAKASDSGAAWVYFADPASKYALYVAGDRVASTAWQYWPMDGAMAVFGFGRELTCCGKYLTAAPARFTIGLVENGGYDAVARAIAGQ